MDDDEDPQPRFEEFQGTDVRMIRPQNSDYEDYTGIAYEYGEEVARDIELPLGKDDTYEVISRDWKISREYTGWVYHLRFNGEIDGHDYVRVMEVEEDDLREVR